MILSPIALEVKPASIVRTLTHAEFRSWLKGQAATLEVEEARPSVGPDYIPSPAELDEAAELLNDDQPDWDGLAEASLALDVVSSGYAWM